MKMLAAGALLMTMACTAVPPESANGEAPRDMSAGRCDAGSLGDLVGRPASQDLGAEAMRRSGARVLRWIRPGDIVTMDYSEARLNVHLDGQNRVDHFACG